MKTQLINVIKTFYKAYHQPTRNLGQYKMIVNAQLERSLNVTNFSKGCRKLGSSPQKNWYYTANVWRSVDDVNQKASDFYIAHEVSPILEGLVSWDGNVKENVPLNNNISRLKQKGMLSSGVFPLRRLRSKYNVVYTCIIHVLERRQSEVVGGCT